MNGWIVLLILGPLTAVAHTVTTAEPEWKGHWAFQAVTMPELPPVEDAGWPRTEIDTFVLARLEEEGLRPSPRADKHTLIRRVTFDLLGVPPSPDDVRAFEADGAPDAYVRLIDRLLTSPRYGERWARHWLDVARYADTKGYVFFSEPRLEWAYTYRDYVIESFNEDRPYDRFVTEQIAADRLDLGTDRRPLRAMGFLTVGQRFLNNEHDTIDDRIDVVTRGFLGLTVNCARCHDHKYDPIPTQDYYSLYGIFASSIEPPVRPLFEAPLKTSEYEAFDKELQKRNGELREFVEKTYREVVNGAKTRLAEYMMVVHAAKDQPNTDEFMVLVEVGELNPKILQRWQAYFRKTHRTDHPVFGLWNALAELPESDFAARAQSVLSHFQSELQGPAGRSPAATNPLILDTFSEDPPESLEAVAKTYSAVLNETDRLWQQEIENAVEKELPVPERFEDPSREELRQVFHHPLAPPNAPLPELGACNFLLFPTRAIQAAFHQRIISLETWQDRGKGAPPRAMVLLNRKQPVDPYVFQRGNPNSAGERVPRQFLGFLAGERRRPFQAGSGRLGLAKAIVDPSNPLTARVLVNRIWMHHFGTPLVTTPSDFGVRSPRPSHPELLDFLAAAFMSDGWSIKRLQRRLLISSSYQQQSQHRPEGVARDPGNRLLWRMNRRRLDFESMRDALLEVSGNLENTLGGRSFPLFSRPYIKRRTLYGFLDRLALPSVLRRFDFPSPEATSAQRPKTTTAPQALFLMNNPFVVECARDLWRAVSAGGDDDFDDDDFDARIRAIHRRVFLRDPSARELELARWFFEPHERPRVAFEDWRYGFGEFDAETQTLAGFVPFEHWAGSSWQGGAKLPDAKRGWVFIDKKGGHPASEPSRLAAVRRWIAPAPGVIEIRGELGHGHKEGDGVAAFLISGRHGVLGQWTAKNSSEETARTVEVEKGDTLDFVVDCRENQAHDQFEWTVLLRCTGAQDRAITRAGTREGTRDATREDQWDSQANFRGPQAGVWERYIHGLMQSNEFVYVD